MFKPNKQQAQALVEFAARAGHQWRSKLRNHWNADRYMAGKQDEHALLRQVRNGAEPTWLHKVKLEDIKRLANPGLEDNGKAKLGSTFDTLYCGDFKSQVKPAGHTPPALLVSAEGQGSLLIRPGQLDSLVSLLCLAKEHGHVQ